MAWRHQETVYADMILSWYVQNIPRLVWQGPTNSLGPSGALQPHRSGQGVWNFFSASVQSLKPKMFFSFIQFQNFGFSTAHVIFKRPGSGSTLALVMACCLMVRSHYLNQFWLIIKGVLCHLPENNFTRSTQRLISNPKHLFGDYTFELLHLPGANELTYLPLVLHICVSELGQHWFR